MTRTKTKALALVAASSLAVLGFFITKPAFAGENGQQLQICQQSSEDYTQMFLNGSNQNGDFTSAIFAIAPGGCGSTVGFYWVGQVSVELRASATGRPSRNGSCNVPKEQAGGDLTNCFL